MLTSSRQGQSRLLLHEHAYVLEALVLRQIYNVIFRRSNAVKGKISVPLGLVTLSPNS